MHAKENRVRFEENDEHDDDSDYDDYVEGNQQLKSSSPRKIDWNDEKDDIKLDPVRAVIDAVIQRTGADRAKISALVNVMFDRGLPYDDTNEVIAELKRMEERHQGSDNNRIHVEVDDVTNTSKKKKDTKKIKKHKGKESTNSSLVFTSSVSVEGNNSASTTLGDDERVFEEDDDNADAPCDNSNIDIVSSSSSFIDKPATATSTAQSSPSNGSSSTLSHSSPSSSMPISQRLEVIASHPDLSAALEALCAWAGVHKQSLNSTDSSKTSTDIGSTFFVSSALEIILNRLLADPKLFTDSKVRPVVEVLFGYVLDLPSSSQKTIRSICAHMESIAKVLLEARLNTASLQGGELRLCPVNGESYRSVVSRLSSDVRALYSACAKDTSSSSSSLSSPASQSLKDMDDNILKLSKAINALPKMKGSTDPSSSAHLVRLLEERELQYEKAQLSVQAYCIRNSKDDSSGTRTSVNSRDKNQILPERDCEDKNRTLTQLLTQDIGETPMSLNSKQAVNNSSLSVDQLLRYRDTQARPIQEEMMTVSQQMVDAERRKNDLLTQVKSLEIEISVGRARYSSLETALLDLQRQQQMDMQGMSVSQAVAMGARQSSMQIQSVITCLTAFESDVNDICSDILCSTDGIIASEEGKYRRNQDGPSMSVVSENIAAYVITELKCLQAIASRVLTIDEKMKKLLAEVNDYRALDMHVVVTDIENVINKLRHNRDEDIGSIDSITDALSSLLEEFMAVGNHDIGTLPVPQQLLLDSSSLLSSIKMKTPRIIETILKTPDGLTDHIHSTTDFPSDSIPSLSSDGINMNLSPYQTVTKLDARTGLMVNQRSGSSSPISKRVSPHPPGFTPNKVVVSKPLPTTSSPSASKSNLSFTTGASQGSSISSLKSLKQVKSNQTLSEMKKEAKSKIKQGNKNIAISS